MNSESKLGRFLHKRFTLKRRRSGSGSDRNNKGIGPTGVVVTIVILAILAGIGGPALWGLITGAREFAVNSTVQQAAETVRNRLTLEPELMDAATTTELENALLEEYDLDWVIGDPFSFARGTGNETTMHLQFLTKGGAAIPTPSSAPVVPWLLSDNRAVRIQAQNSDGAWACALIVMRPNVDAGEHDDAEHYVRGTGYGVPTNTSDTKTNVWLGGIWYDSGEEPLETTAPFGLHACSPVYQDAASSYDYTLPKSTTEWDLGDPAPGSAPSGGTAPASPWRTLKNSL